MVSGNRQAERAREAFVTLQANLQNSLRNLDPEVTCTEDSWDREEGGGGTTIVFSEGAIMEKGAVNFSDVLPNPSGLSRKFCFWAPCVPGVPVGACVPSSRCGSDAGPGALTSTQRPDCGCQGLLPAAAVVLVVVVVVVVAASLGSTFFTLLSSASR